MGYGAVWVVAPGERDSQLLRIDPATGRITHRTRVAGRRALDSVAVGLGYVWTVGSSSGTLYRFDARTGRRRGQLLVGTNRAPRPYLMRGFVWVGLTVFRPRTLDTVTWLSWLLRRLGGSRRRFRLRVVDGFAHGDRCPVGERLRGRGDRPRPRGGARFRAPTR